MASDVKHTPGPYHVVEFLPGKSGCLAGIAAEGHDTIHGDAVQATSIQILSETAHMRGVYGSGHGGHLADIPIPHEGRAQALANAHVMAAGPELLGALELMLAVYAPLYFPKVVTNAFAAAVLDARAAIAKALGPVPRD